MCCKSVLEQTEPLHMCHNWRRAGCGFPSRPKLPIWYTWAVCPASQRSPRHERSRQRGGWSRQGSATVVPARSQAVCYIRHQSRCHEGCARQVLRGADATAEHAVQLQSSGSMLDAALVSGSSTPQRRGFRAASPCARCQTPPSGDGLNRLCERLLPS